MDATDVYSRPEINKCAGDAIPLLVDGVYHLFHLTPPAYTIFHPNRCRCSWDRLKSTDLINWTRDPLPVIPHGSHEDDVDSNGAWTGSALIGPDDKMHIFYTGYNMKRGGEQVILHATAPDKHGSSFTKPNGPIPVVSKQGLAAFESIDFRDPYVFWNATEEKYWMLVATRLAAGPHWTRGAVALLTSSDLEDWHADPEPLYAPNDIFCPECPELFSLPNGKWYLVYSRFSAPYSGTLYRVADGPRGPFRTPRDGSVGLFDGRRWYAAKSCPKAGDPSKRICFGWVPDYYEKDGKWLWGGSLCPPRELSARADGSLRLDPLPELLSTQRLPDDLSPSSFPDQVKLQSLGKTSARFLPVLPASLSARQRYSLAFQIGKQDARSFGVLIQTDDDMRGHQLRFEPVPNVIGLYTVTLLTDIAPLCDFWADLNSVHVPKLVDGAEVVRHGAVRVDAQEPPLRVFVTGRVLEAFVGGKVLTYRLPARKEFEAGEHGVGAPPKADKIHDLGFFVEDGEVEIFGISLTVSGRIIP